MQLGRFQLTTVSGGQFRLDGGAMFGIVPRPLWSRVYPPDEHGRIQHDTNCVLVQTGEHTVLIDTGYGPKLSEKEREIHAAEEGEPLARSLEAAGVSFAEIDTVILSHLHFDHAGGASRRDEQRSPALPKSRASEQTSRRDDAGGIVPAFPHAEYVVQRREWVMATAGFPELAGAYPQENLAPLAASGRLRLIDGDVEIVPGVHALVTGGHTEGHQALIIESGGETAIYLGDLCPTTRHLPVLWGMAYDIDVLQLRRMKRQVLGRVADEGWLALFDHDPDHAAGRLERHDKRDFALAEGIERL